MTRARWIGVAVGVVAGAAPLWAVADPGVALPMPAAIAVAAFAGAFLLPLFVFVVVVVIVTDTVLARRLAVAEVVRARQ